MADPALPEGEAGFIAALRTLATHPAARGLADDTAVLEVGGEALVLTHDAIAEGVHVLPDMDPADVAWRLVATNISDLAAKGAQPLGVLLGYALGDASQNARFLVGLAEALAAYDVPLLGGDTIRMAPGLMGSAPRSFGLTAIGRATHRPVPARGGAKPGDTLWLTGAVGAAMIGYEAMRANSTANPTLTAPYRRPRALLTEGIALAPHVSAMMDISDGLLLDASRMARASGVTLSLESLSVPIAAPEDRRADALRWGDDYQLLFTAPADAALPIPACRIGTALPQGETPLLIDDIALNENDNIGWEH